MYAALLNHQAAFFMPCVLLQHGLCVNVSALMHGNHEVLQAACVCEQVFCLAIGTHCLMQLRELRFKAICLLLFLSGLLQ